ncbi:phosphosulfolactate synthase [Bacillus sp. V59.32b]|uniref:phosphosulfolactate synthase n=1 Tax=Bacillus sp. V59.32b TaxID=1758642 RepID=UPI000E3D8F27|nr:phosphosulfolactate synthase [Bacillus sp. V59.32b]RFU68556.1 phosphosulfolactate synthase [Bacillus sp. V59.32b]
MRRSCGIYLPPRQEKPREKGITILIDNGVPLSFFKDTVSGAADFIDYVKFGWGTSIITKTLEEKIECLNNYSIPFFFGGTLFEKFVSQGKITDFYLYCKKYGCQYIEISNGTFEMTNTEKARFISDFSDEFLVFSEVGQKDSEKAITQEPAEWVEYIQEDFEAGAIKVITEARESGTSGMCRGNGELRSELVEQIVSSGINLNNMIFEAPNKKLQTFFIQLAGSDVNLANIAFTDIIPLETLRLGLRSDTFTLFDRSEINERKKQSVSPGDPL